MRPRLHMSLTSAPRDTVPAPRAAIRAFGDSMRVRVRDSVPARRDSGSIRDRIDTFNIRMSPDSLDAPVDYKAEDSMVLEVDTKKILLYGKTEVKYTDVSLSAPFLVFDQQSQVVTARMGRDSTGNVMGMAKLVQDQTTTVSDSIRFNFKSQKGADLLRRAGTVHHLQPGYTPLRVPVRQGEVRQQESGGHRSCASGI